jgi:hypothetical protein
MTLYSPEHLEALRTKADWLAELSRQFGYCASNVLHTAEGQGLPRSKLRELYIAFMAAQEAWHASMGFHADD